MHTVSVKEAAALLGVSAATVRNWRRAGLLPSVAARPFAFAREAVRTLRARIRANAVPRLRARANKTASAVSSASAGRPAADPQDPLGSLYQESRAAGAKARAGAYFTPAHVIEDSLRDFPRPPRSFLDPCCGTGRYLLRAAARFGIAPENLHGFDSDPAAVAIARENLRFLSPPPDIRCLDTLTDPAVDALAGTLDAIATNPPWGASGIPGAGGESFALFLEKSLALLRPGGMLSFLLPESVLRVKAHALLRRRILAETTVVKITLHGRVFPEVFTPVVRLTLVKRRAAAGARVTVEEGGKSYSVPQARFAENGHAAFDAGVTEEDAELLRRLYAVPHATLRGNADWALGIVTGDNARLVLHAREEGAEPVLRGRDVLPFALRPPERFLRFAPESFQQCAPERLYRAPEKLVYRFIAERPVFAYDTGGVLTLNSANVLVPRVPGMSVKTVLAFLNSRVFGYIFEKKFQTRKVLRGDLERLPFPWVDARTDRELGALADACMRGDAGAGEEIDRRVEEIFGVCGLGG